MTVKAETTPFPLDCTSPTGPTPTGPTPTGPTPTGPSPSPSPTPTGPSPTPTGPSPSPSPSPTVSTSSGIATIRVTTLQLKWTSFIDIKSESSSAVPDDVPLSTVSVEIISNPTHGVLFEKDGKHRWVQLATSANFIGIDSFTYKLKATGGWESTVGTVEVKVDPNPDLSPAAAAGKYRLGSDAPPMDVEDEPGASGKLSMVHLPHFDFATKSPTPADGVIENNVRRWLDGTHAVPDFLLPTAFATASVEAKAMLTHFLNEEDGSDRIINLEKLLAETAAARAEYEASFNAATGLLKSLQFVGTLNFTESKATLVSTGGPWGIVTGQFTGWGNFSVVGSVSASVEMQYNMNFHYNLWDPYDWNPDKGNNKPAGPSLADQAAQKFARLHLVGYAKQFMMHGIMDKTAGWTGTAAPPPPPPIAPGP